MNDYKANILVVDDTLNNVRVLSKMLALKGFKVFKALSGEMALIACEGNDLDLILLDIIMPEMDGYAVCGCLKASEKTRNIPLIFLSALSNVEDKVKAFELGGVDYITKPFEEEELLTAIESRLAKSAILKDQRSVQINKLILKKSEGIKSLDELTKVKDFPIDKIDIIKLYLTLN